MTDRSELPTNTKDLKTAAPKLGSSSALPDMRKTSLEELEALKTREADPALGGLSRVPDPTSEQTFVGSIDLNKPLASTPIAPPAELPSKTLDPEVEAKVPEIVLGSINPTHIDATRPANFVGSIDPSQTIAPESTFPPGLDATKPVEVHGLDVTKPVVLPSSSKTLDPLVEAKVPEIVLGSINPTHIDATRPANFVGSIDPKLPISREATVPQGSSTIDAFLSDLDALTKKPINHAPEILTTEPMTARETRTGELTLKRYTSLVQLAGFSSLQTFSEALKDKGLHQQVSDLRRYVQAQQPPSLEDVPLSQ